MPTPSRHAATLHLREGCDAAAAGSHPVPPPLASGPGLLSCRRPGVGAQRAEPGNKHVLRKQVRDDSRKTELGSARLSTMRVPYAVPPLTLRAYDCSKETRHLAGEARRLLRAESASWDQRNAASLRHLAVLALVHNFSGELPDGVLRLQIGWGLRATRCPQTAPRCTHCPRRTSSACWRRCR